MCAYLMFFDSYGKTNYYVTFSVEQQIPVAFIRNIIYDSILYERFQIPRFNSHPLNRL